MSYARIIGTGGYLPRNVMTNHDLEKIVETSDQWIRERTGIEQRHIAADDETTVDLAEQASRNAIEAAGIDPSEIDLIIFATSTPDKIFPSSACILQARLDIHGCPAFDIQAVCRRLQSHNLDPEGNDRGYMSNAQGGHSHSRNIR